MCIYSCTLGIASHLDGEDVDAHTMFGQSLAIARRNGDQLMADYATLGFALIASRADDVQAAATLHGTADAIHDKLGTLLESIESRLRDADLSRLETRLGTEAFQAAYGAGYTPGIRDTSASVR